MKIFENNMVTMILALIMMAITLFIAANVLHLGMEVLKASDFMMDWN